MKKIIYDFCCLTCLLLLTSCGAGGPFGLSKGMTLDQIDETAQQIDHGVYTTQNVPHTHSSFKRYALIIGPTTGLCKVKAVSKSIATNSSGDQLRTKYESMRSRLDKIYGQGETTDSIEPESMWKDPEQFMMGLVEKDRVLATVWKINNGSQFKDEIEFVFLKALPTRSDNGFLMLEYEFKGFATCLKEISRWEDTSSYDARFY